jgi:hypothetical protein
MSTEKEIGLDRSKYYLQRAQQLRREIGMQEQTVAELQQRLFMLQAELSAFEHALTLENPPNERSISLAELPQTTGTEEEAAADDAMAQALLKTSPVLSTLADENARSKNEEPPSFAEMLRIILGQNSGGMTPTEILTEFASRGQAIKREYLYALLSRLRSRGELKRRAKKYWLNEGRASQWGKLFTKDFPGAG